MRLLFGDHVVGEILEDGGVTVNLTAVTAALREFRKTGAYPPVDLDKGRGVAVDLLIALQALASHKHATEGSLASLRRWLKGKL